MFPGKKTGAYQCCPKRFSIKTKKGSTDVASRNKNIFIETSNQYELQILRKSINTLDSHKILFGSMYPYRLTSTGLKIFDMLNLKKQYLNLIFNHNARSILKI